MSGHQRIETQRQVTEWNSSPGQVALAVPRVPHAVVAPSLSIWIRPASAPVYPAL